MESGEFDVVERNATGAEYTTFFGHLTLLVEAVLYLEYILLTGFVAFENTNYRAYNEDQKKCPSVVCCIHSRSFTGSGIKTVFLLKTLYWIRKNRTIYVVFLFNAHPVNDYLSVTCHIL